jgi:hypothetical protein
LKKKVILKKKRKKNKKVKFEKKNAKKKKNTVVIHIILYGESDSYLIGLFYTLIMLSCIKNCFFLLWLSHPYTRNTVILKEEGK